MNQRLPEQHAERYRALEEKIDAYDGKVFEVIRRRDLERKDLSELEAAHRLRQESDRHDEDLDAKFNERLNRVRKAVERLNQRYNELGTEKMQLVRLKERCQKYLLDAGYLLPDDEDGVLRNVAVRGIK